MRGRSCAASYGTSKTIAAPSAVLEAALSSSSRLRPLSSGRGRLGIRTPLGLLAEEYDADAGRLVGNFPQAFSHVGVVNSAAILDRAARASPKTTR